MDAHPITAAQGTSTQNPETVTPTAPDFPPGSSPVLGEASDNDTLDTRSPLQPGDRVKTLLAGRTGQVVRTYDDGSASICWDGGEPQAEGLGHERMPRAMLAYIGHSEQGLPGASAEFPVNSPQKLTVQECMAQLKTLNTEIYDLIHLADAQVRGIGKMGESMDRGGDVHHVLALVEIAAKLLCPYEDLFEHFDDVIYALNNRLFSTPDPEEHLPECVWLELIERLTDEKPDMWRLTEATNALALHASFSPEANAAVECLKTYADRNGAEIYYHRGVNKMAYRWKDEAGRAAAIRAGLHRPAHETVLA